MKKVMSEFDAQANSASDPRAFWESASLLIAIWTSGGTPASGYDPRYNASMMPLFKALQKFGSALTTEINSRAFAA